MSEPVVVWRGVESEDTYGNPIIGEPEPFSTWEADVADAHYEEPAIAGRAAVLVGGTIYIRDQGPTGILPTDLLEARSPVPTTAPVDERREHLLPVDGHPAVWYRKSDGTHRGDVVTFRRADG